MPRQADPAHHVDVEEALPIRVGDFIERLGLEDADIVDQDVGVARALDKGFDTSRRAEVGGAGLDLRPRQGLCQALPGGSG